MKNIRPVYVMCEAGVDDFQLEAITAGISEVLHLAGVSPRVLVTSFGVWRQQNWQDKGGLLPYSSIDWYIANAKKYSEKSGQLSGDAIMRDLQTEPWQKMQPHYDVVVLSSDMYSEGTNFVIGLAISGLGTVVSVARFRSLDRDLQSECLKTEVIHELGHVFGLPREDRLENVAESLGKHCTNLCTMRQGLEVPKDWIRMTSDRLALGAFCSQCRQDLQGFFS